MAENIIHHLKSWRFIFFSISIELKKLTGHFEIFWSLSMFLKLWKFMRQNTDNFHLKLTATISPWKLVYAYSVFWDQKFKRLHTSNSYFVLRKIYVCLYLLQGLSQVISIKHHTNTTHDATKGLQNISSSSRPRSMNHIPNTPRSNIVNKLFYNIIKWETRFL